MTLRDLRRTLGRVRDSVLYGRRDRRLAAAADAARTGWIATATERLAPLPPPSGAAVEMHTLCGEKQATMGIWSSWSLLRFLPQGRLVVHSDGSLTEPTVELWRRAVPGLRLVGPEESDAAMAARLGAFPRVLDWSRRYHFGRKLGGFYSTTATPRQAEIDTDTLTFRPPEALVASLAPGGLRMTWNRDERDCYAYPPPLLAEVLGDLLPAPLPPRLNGGYMTSFAFGDDEWATLEAALERLERDPRTDPLRYWMHQTLLAIVADRLGDGAGPLPDAYDVHGGPTAPDAIMRHYVGVPGVRPRFFAEGVAMVVRDARRRGQLPADFARDAVPDQPAAAPG